MRIKERKLDCLSQEKLQQAHCFVRCLGWEGGQECSYTCMPKVVEGALDVKFEEKRVLVRDVGQGNHVVGSEESLNGLATWDCPNLDMEGWPVGMEAAHQNAREKLLQNFKEKDGTNLGCSGGGQLPECAMSLLQLVVGMCFALRKAIAEGIGGGVACTAQFLESRGVLEFAAGKTILTVSGKATQVWPVWRGRVVLKALLEALCVNLPAASVLLAAEALPLARLEESGFPCGCSTVVGDWLVVVWQVAGKHPKFKPTFVENEGAEKPRPLEGVEHGSGKSFVHQNGLAMVAAKLVSGYNPVVAQLSMQLHIGVIGSQEAVGGELSLGEATDFLQSDDVKVNSLV
eukprot:s988_g3.t1